MPQSKATNKYTITQTEIVHVCARVCVTQETKSPVLPLPPPSPRAQRPLIAVSSGERGRESLRPRHQQPLLLTVASYNVLVRPRRLYKQTPCLGFEWFPCVCPEPVLADCSVLV